MTYRTATSERYVEGRFLTLHRAKLRSRAARSIATVALNAAAWGILAGAAARLILA